MPWSPDLGERPSILRAHAREDWLPFLDTHRTQCIAPGTEFVGLLTEIRSLPIAAFPLTLSGLDG